MKTQEEKEEITFKIKYEDGMTNREKRLVDAINESNDAVIMAFNATVQNQSELLLGEIKKLQTDVSTLRTNMNLLLNHFKIDRNTN